MNKAQKGDFGLVVIFSYHDTTQGIIHKFAPCLEVISVRVPSFANG